MVPDQMKHYLVGYWALRADDISVGVRWRRFLKDVTERPERKRGAHGACRCSWIFLERYMRIFFN